LWNDNSHPAQTEMVMFAESYKTGNVDLAK
jgi:hypothetical protein